MSLKNSLKGIDISHHNKYQFQLKHIDFSKYDFIMMKATEGRTFVDPMRETYMNEIIRLEKRYGFKVDDSEKVDLTTEAERLCEKLAKDKFNHEFLFVTDFPADKRAFYHMRKNGVLQGYDLIWKGIEITTGAQREHRYEELKKSAQEKGLAKDVEFYLQFFKYGCPPHGGFAIGVDRLTMILLNLVSLKEAQFLFRGPDRLTP